MTYREILEKLSRLTDEELNLDVTILDVEDDEYYPVDSIKITRGYGVLDDGHPILCIKSSALKGRGCEAAPTS